MTRWLAWGLGGLLAVGVLVRLGASSGKEKTPSADRSPTSGAVRPTPAPRATSDQEYRDILLKDDSLPPPAPGASEVQRRAFAETLEAIEKGQDPIVSGKRDNSDVMKRRLEVRKTSAQERRSQVQKEIQARRAKVEEIRKDLMRRAGRTPLGPNEKRELPPDDPARVEPPNLGDPLIEDPPKQP